MRRDSQQREARVTQRTRLPTLGTCCRYSRRDAHFNELTRPQGCPRIVAAPHPIHAAWPRARLGMPARFLLRRERLRSADCIACCRAIPCNARGRLQTSMALDGRPVLARPVLVACLRFLLYLPFAFREHWGRARRRRGECVWCGEQDVAAGTECRACRRRS